MDIKIVEDKISLQELNELATQTFVDMVKAVVDLEQKIMAVGGQLHSDAEAMLLSEGSNQKDLWGFNIYPAKSEEDRIEFSSLINIRPSQGNNSMEIEDLEIQKQITEIVNNLIL